MDMSRQALAPHYRWETQCLSKLVLAESFDRQPYHLMIPFFSMPIFHQTCSASRLSQWVALNGRLVTRKTGEGWKLAHIDGGEAAVAYWPMTYFSMRLIASTGQHAKAFSFHVTKVHKDINYPKSSEAKASCHSVEDHDAVTWTIKRKLCSSHHWLYAETHIRWMHQSECLDGKFQDSFQKHWLLLVAVACKSMPKRQWCNGACCGLRRLFREVVTRGEGKSWKLLLKIDEIWWNIDENCSDLKSQWTSLTSELTSQTPFPGAEDSQGSTQREAAQRISAGPYRYQ